MGNICNIMLATTLLGTMSYGQMKENKLGLNVGLSSIHNEDSIDLNNLSAGITYKLGEVNSAIKPRFDLDYMKISDYKDVSSVMKSSINGVYEFMESKTISPYALAGIGYEVVNNDIHTEFNSRAFAQGAIGVTYHQYNNFDINLEGKVLQTFGAENQDNEVILTLGVAIPVGTLFKGNNVANECPVKISGADEDRDGIRDAIDQCPNTPCYFSVDNVGCPISATLRIHFDTNKATIRSYSMQKVEKFAEFLLSNKGSYVKIEGHTDSDADEGYNMNLSEQRANTVMHKLIELGVSANRLSAAGRGESMPIASNSTTEGKSLNRRIEVTLTYPRR